MTRFCHNTQFYFIQKQVTKLTILLLKKLIRTFEEDLQKPHAIIKISNLCMKVSTSLGQSACTTQSRCGMSTPLSHTSVLNITHPPVFLLNSSKLDLLLASLMWPLRCKMEVPGRSRQKAA